jgi:hypothetical protein
MWVLAKPRRGAGVGLTSVSAPAPLGASRGNSVCELEMCAWGDCKGLVIAIELDCRLLVLVVVVVVVEVAVAGAVRGLDVPESVVNVALGELRLAK